MRNTRRLRSSGLGAGAETSDDRQPERHLRRDVEQHSVFIDQPDGRLRLTRDRFLEERGGLALFNPDEDLIGPEAGDGRFTHPFDMHQIGAAFLDGHQVHAALEILREGVQDRLTGCARHAFDGDAGRIDAIFGRGREQEPRIGDQEALEAMEGEESTGEDDAIRRVR